MSDVPDQQSTTGIFPGDGYPSQLRAGPQPGYHGEYRGFYPEGSEGGGKWHPRWSQNGGRPGGHRGIDIYAPYAPHPLETPVRAVVKGRLNCRPGRFDPNALGNRAEIHFGTENKKFSYGHLSRFEGRNREVEPGDVIGYAGCTGNADTQNECRRCGDCNVNSGHVHLQVMRGTNEYFDPLDHCTLRLHAAEADSFENKDCAAWVDAATGRGLTAKWTPPPPDPNRPRLELGSMPVRRRDGGKRRPLDAPFGLIEFDSTAMLEKSRTYYDCCRRRFAEAATLANATSEPGKAFRDFHERNLTAAAAALRTGASGALGEMRRRILEGGAAIGLGATDEAARVPGWLLRHLSVLGQMLWVAAGGAALDRIADNTAGDSGDDRYRVHPQLKSGAGYHRLLTPNPLECGASLGGHAWLSAADGGRQALHLTSIVTPTGGGATRDDWIVSVTFGAGSLMHATVSERMKHPAHGGTPESAEAEAAIAAYLDALYVAAVRIGDVCQLASMHTVLLSGEGGPTVQAGRAQTLAELRDRIVAAADALERCPRGITDDALAKKIVRRMAESLASLFADLVAESKKPEQDAPMCPSLLTLHVRQAAAG